MGATVARWFILAYMTKADASDEIGTALIEDLDALQRHVSDSARKAEAATQSYERTAWIAYAAIFVPIPLVLLLFRLHMQAWHLYVAGALFVAVMFVVYAMDAAAVAKRDMAIQAAQRAHEAYEDAQMLRREAS